MAKYNRRYEPPKLQYITISEIASVSGWVPDWDDFLWYIADYCCIQSYGQNWCKLEYVSTSQELYVKSIIENYKPKKLRTRISECSMTTTLRKKLSDAIRNEALIMYYLLRHGRKYNNLDEIGVLQDDELIMLSKEFQRKSKQYSDIIQREEEYTDTIDLQKHTGIEEKLSDICKTLQSAPGYITHPAVSSGKILCSDNTIILFDAGTSAATITILKNPGSEIIWCGSYGFIISSDNSIRLTMIDDYMLTLYCSRHKVHHPQPGEFSSKYYEICRQYIKDRSEENHAIRKYIDFFVNLMGYINYYNYNTHEKPVFNINSSKSNGSTHRSNDKQWGVKGHWRKYASGKTVYIEPHVRGSGVYSKKKYKLTEENKLIQDSRRGEQLK